MQPLKETKEALHGASYFTMNLDNIKMNALINKSTNVELKDDEWFSWANQRKLTYLMAKELLLSEDMTPDEAIDLALEFNKAFYRKVIDYKNKNK